MRSVIVALLLVFATAVAAVAVPPPPPNPSQSDIDAGRREARDKAGEVGRLTNQLARAEARLMDLHAEVEARMEEANKALVDLQTAQDAAREARADAEAAAREAEGAARAVTDARQALDDFAAGSFKQGSTVGSISAYIGASSPEDLLARAQLLNAVGGSGLDALERMERARTVQANKDSLARAALAEAERAEADAELAKAAADSAMASAQQARRDAEARTAELEAARADYERQLVAAQAKVGGLEAQRERYNEWLAAKRREEAAANAPRPVSVQAPPSAPASGSVQVVIDRALSQLGVPYAWGGGNAHGPTRGIRDGGVADSHGDYNKIGFDCSGLMIYAFAGVGIRLPHYSGYQATYGRKVPLSAMRPGDMLFWSTRGRIHHVALYLGDGQMVEAPYSGSRVRVAPVRWGGLEPYAVRLL
ncbi:NlpC/P60 family protein [Actinokineospora sp. UTMC 2448]|uniref:NlpC/P60 family protein n=1 Tax=Actinokineospora sp. UTMC 2448 TaxID=2268449 RepID=UPI002164C10C|nr:NlpC/P60 family protein [Actinokineospora sp. UTMC 2448]UVS80256.1 Peptidoglycan endopeptidase RipA precursor [Actinokineospora sp. UTMC 2448]